MLHPFSSVINFSAFDFLDPKSYPPLPRCPNVITCSKFGWTRLALLAQYFTLFSHLYIAALRSDIYQRAVDISTTKLGEIVTYTDLEFLLPGWWACLWAACRLQGWRARATSARCRTEARPLPARGHVSTRSAALRSLSACKYDDNDYRLSIIDHWMILRSAS